MKKEFSFPLLLAQISLLFTIIISATSILLVISKGGFNNFEGFELFKVYFRIFIFLAFYTVTFLLLLKRKKLGLIFILLFFLFYLIRNLYGLYTIGLDNSPIEEDGIFNITKSEIEGAMFAQKYGPVIMSLIQIFFITYFIFSKKIRRMFSIKEQERLNKNI